ncbi:5-methylcytosine-specific restriction protein A [Neorhizobium sp. 2083]|uniref:HNH endonuclease n=1 Tax=Neorhizobium sp. 2083 TaxID=2817762 RepID=UPI002865EF3C|nr:hypothetical protein [Neorhizobium sp. 2083]MDR6819574.1 5-methylcytosine-specific restriction protein A [Neorhizobium sp. 2083]
MLLQDNDGNALDARVDITDDGIILHSRSGKDRNPDYREALEALLSRLDSAGIQYEIYLDSRPVQTRELAGRQLHFDIQASVERRFNEIVRAMNVGSSSHGAWRRLLITTPGVATDDLEKIIKVFVAEIKVARLSATELRQVTSLHIQHAVEKLLNGGDAPNFAPSRDYDAMTGDGTPLAPKKVFGLALEEALGIEAFPGHFSAGWGQVSFELLEKAGLWIARKGDGVPRPVPTPSEMKNRLAEFIPTEEEKIWIEGNPKIVSHLVRERQPGLAKKKREEFLAEHGRLFCEDCQLDPLELYGEEVGAACIEVHHHRTQVAEMQPGHQSTTADLKCLCANCHRVLHRRLALGLI